MQSISMQSPFALFVIVLVRTVGNGMARGRDILAGTRRGVTGTEKRCGAQQGEQGERQYGGFLAHGIAYL
jgi:hypothetical protein